jgi:hypothetical protein
VAVSRWKRLLGLDQATAHGVLDVQVRYLDGAGRDGDASGIGFVNVSPRGLVWKIDGYNIGNRDWPDVASWTQRPLDAAQAQLVIVFEGMLRVRQETSHMRITVNLTSSAKEVRRLNRIRVTS